MTYDTMDDIQYQPKAKRYVLVAIILSVGVLGYFLWSSSNAPDPLKVLVLVEYDGETEATSETIAQQADLITDRLKGLGLDVVTFSDPEAALALRKGLKDNGLYGLLRPPFVHCAPALVIQGDELEDGN